MALALALSPLLELIANDRPIVVEYNGLPLFPVFRSYPETKYGGDFADFEADYRDPYLQKMLDEKGAWVLWPPIRYSYGTHNLDLCASALIPHPPPWTSSAEECPGDSRSRQFGNQNWLGTDDQGRDILTMTMYGARLYVYFTLIVLASATCVGGLLAMTRFMLAMPKGITGLFYMVPRSIPILFILMITVSELWQSFQILAFSLSLYFSATLSGSINR